MIITRTIPDIRNHLQQLHPAPVGFVPTMGALHNGHLSLVKAAIADCRVVAVSIFVNPTQFNDKDDLKNYPRTEKSDLKLLETVMRKYDLVFLPDVKEIYPAEDNRLFSFGNLDKVMEGKQRPGHFNGVAQVVSRLFDIVEPDRAYFGQKDFQQLTIIRELVRQTGYKVRISACPIIRESDGLAMSSRNRLLEPGLRQKAGIIFRAISEAANSAGKADIDSIKAMVSNLINTTPGFSLEYFEIVDDISLKPLTTLTEAKPENKYYGCIAVKAGRIRLIDNIEISLF